MSSREQLLLAVPATLSEYGIVINNQIKKSPSQCLCWPTPENNEPLHIPYHHVLWAESNAARPSDVDITYVEDRNGNAIVTTITVELAPYGDATKPQYLTIMDHAYAHTKQQQRILVVLNAFGGQGNARSLYGKQAVPVFEAARVDLTYIETKYSGHGVEIARELDINNFDLIVCCSGDGIPYEIINGMYERSDRLEAFNKIAVTQLPCGLGNALAYSSHSKRNTSDVVAWAALQVLKLPRKKIDLMAVTQGTGLKKRTRLSFLSQAYGAIADADIGTDHLRWMGLIRFDLGVAHKVITKAAHPCDIWVEYADTSSENDTRAELSEKTFVCNTDIESPIPDHWRQLAQDKTDHLSIFYAGNMPYVESSAKFFPLALPDDGCIDLVVTDARVLFFTMAKILMQVEHGGHVDHHDVHHMKIKGYRLVPKLTDGKRHYISVDGEEFPLEPMHVEVLPSVLTVPLKEGKYMD